MSRATASIYPSRRGGNMRLMTYAYYKSSGNADYVRQHYPRLQQFARYLFEYSLTHSQQLSTDDFAGQLVNRTNLAIKSIVSVQIMASITANADDATSSRNYSLTASPNIQPMGRSCHRPFREAHTALVPNGNHHTACFTIISLISCSI